MGTVHHLDGFVEPPGKPIVGHFLDVVEEGPDLFLRDLVKHGDRVLYRFGKYEFRQLGDPEDIRHVFVTHASNYVKSKNYEGLKLVLGEGLVTSEGAHWKRQRKLAQPAFQPRSVESFLPTMEACANAMVARWTSGRVLDVHEEMMRVTLRIIGRTIASVDLDGAEAGALGQAIDGVLGFANDYFSQIVKVPTWVPMPSHLRFKRDLGRLDDLVARLVSEHRRHEGPPRDLLDALVAANEGEGGMSDRQLRDEVLTLVMAGHETTANALTWTFHLLSKHPEVLRKVEAEVDREVGDGPLDAATLGRLTYVEQVVKEAMRLYPPAWIIERDALEDDVLPSGAKLPKGQTVAVCTYALHRNPRLWESPEGFDPDRFSPERSAGRSKFAYLPFGAGPRVCLGGHFALLEAKLLVAAVARRHRLDLVAGHPIGLDAGVTLRPAHGMRMHVRRRGGATVVA
ncbi:MAG: cytochrome P450 [Polyangiales bacterium]